MTISSASQHHVFPTGSPMASRVAAAPDPADSAVPDEASTKSDIEIGQLRLAALLGIDPATMHIPSAVQAGGGAGLGSSQKLATETANRANIAPAEVPAANLAPPATSAAGLPPGTVRDIGGTTIAAGTVVDGMVSAGPLSPGLASMTGTVPPSTGTRLLAPASDAASFGYDPIAMIRDRLAKLGVDSGSITFERVTDEIATPGGNRTNQYVRGTFGNGVTENYAVERVLQNPDITAVEIKSLIARGFQPA